MTLGLIVLICVALTLYAFAVAKRVPPGLVRGVLLLPASALFFALPVIFIDGREEPFLAQSLCCILSMSAFKLIALCAGRGCLAAANLDAWTFAGVCLLPVIPRCHPGQQEGGGDGEQPVAFPLLARVRWGLIKLACFVFLACFSLAGFHLASGGGWTEAVGPTRVVTAYDEGDPAAAGDGGGGGGGGDGGDGGAAGGGDMQQVISELPLPGDLQARSVAYKMLSYMSYFGAGVALLLEVDGLGDLVDALALALFRVVPEPHFDKVYLSTSFAELWGRRWNLTVSSVLRYAVYEPVVTGRWLAEGPPDPYYKAPRQPPLLSPLASPSQPSSSSPLADSATVASFPPDPYSFEGRAAGGGVVVRNCSDADGYGGNGSDGNGDHSGGAVTYGISTKPRVPSLLRQRRVTALPCSPPAAPNVSTPTSPDDPDSSSPDSSSPDSSCSCGTSNYSSHSVSRATVTATTATSLQSEASTASLFPGTPLGRMQSMTPETSPPQAATPRELLQFPVQSKAAAAAVEKEQGPAPAPAPAPLLPQHSGPDGNLRTAAGRGQNVPRPSRLRRFLGVQATFLVSGLWHELVCFSMTRRTSGGSWMLLFVIQAPLLFLEQKLRRFSRTRGLQLRPVAARVTTITLLFVQLGLLWYPPMVSTGMLDSIKRQADSAVGAAAAAVWRA